MATLASLWVKLGLDSDDFDKGLHGAADRADKFGSKLNDVGKGMMKAGAAATAGMTLPIVAAGKAMFDAASDMNESMSKVDVVFGQSSGSIKRWADDAAKNLGMSKQEALEATGTLGNLFRSMGTGALQAGHMSTSMVQLSADLGSFNNANPTEVLEALRAGLLGEAEPLRKFGVSLSAARIEAEALAMGLAKPVQNMAKIDAANITVRKSAEKLMAVTKEFGPESVQAADQRNKVALAEQALAKAMQGSKVELTAAQKTQAAYAVIMKDTTLAQGNFALTAGDAANSQKTLGSQFKDLTATLGEQLLPIGKQIISWLSDLVGRFAGLSPEMQKIILAGAGILAVIGPLTTVVGGLVVAFGFLLSPVGLIVGLFAALIAAVAWLYVKNEEFRNSVNDLAKTVGDMVMPVIHRLTEWFQTKLLPALQQAADFIGQKLVGAFDTIKAAIERNRPQLEMLMSWLVTAATWIAEHLVPVLGWLAGMFVGELGNSIGRTIDGIGAFVNTIVWLVATATWARDGVIGAFNGIADAIKGVINFIIRAWNRLEFKLPSVDMGPLGKLGGFTLATSKIPLLAAGGTITSGGLAMVGERGPELLDLDAGAQVRPLPAMESVGGGGTTEIVLEVDGYRLGKVVVPGVRAGLADVTRRNGNNIGISNDQSKVGLR